MKKEITLALVENHLLFRKGMLSLLKEFKNLTVLFEASNGMELLELLKQKQPDVILLDLEMPVMDGFEATSLVREKYPKIKIIILTMYKEDGFVFDLIKRGANGFLSKDGTGLELVADAIHSVMENGFYFNDKISLTLIKDLSSEKKINPRFIQTSLTSRELEMMKLICIEHTNKEIAEILNLSQKTIEQYRGIILKKISARNTAGIVMYAMKNNLMG